MHIVCSICSDHVYHADNLFVTKCGHLFHHHCLEQWIERSNTCPQCRCKLTNKCMFRLYPSISSETSKDFASTLQSHLDDAKLHLQLKEELCKKKDVRISALSSELEKAVHVIKFYKKKLEATDSTQKTLEKHIRSLATENLNMQNLKAENEQLKKNIQMLEGLQKALLATEEEVEEMLKGYSDLKTVATYATALKRAFCESQSKNSKLCDLLIMNKRKIAEEKRITADLQAQLIHYEDKLAYAERKYDSLKKKRNASDMDVESSASKQPRMERSTTGKIMVVNVSESMEVNVSDCSTLNTMVSCMESPDAPRLILKQSSPALSTLQRVNLPTTGNLKPSKMLNADSSATTSRPQSTRIFHKKQPTKPKPAQKLATSDLTPSNDGLGGHSKPDTFPVALSNTKSYIPRLAVKRKLKRPTPSSS